MPGSVYRLKNAETSCLSAKPGKGLPVRVINLRFVRIWLVVCVAMIAFSSFALAEPTTKAKYAQPSGAAKNVLVLHSYHQGMLWADETIKGLRDAAKNSPLPTELWFEMMDMKRLPSTDRFEALKEQYKRKYEGIEIPIVLTVDDDALRFALRYRDELWPGSAIVFCGVNYYGPELLFGHSRVTGVVESIDLQDTIELAARLFPEERELYIINDRSSTGQANKKALQTIQGALPSSLVLHSLEDLSMEELLVKLDSLPDSAPVLLLSFNLDRLGRVFSYSESVGQIRPHIRGPLFGVWHFYMNRGLLGGYLLSGEDHGHKAFDMVVKILQGVPVKNLPVVEHLPSRLVIDYELAQRFGISEADLPADVKWVNRTPTFYEQHSALAHTLSVAFGVLVVVILALVINIRSRQRAETALRKSESLYRLLADNIADVVFVLDRDLNLTYISPSIERLRGQSPEQSLRAGFFSMFSSEDRDELRNVLARELHRTPLGFAQHASLALELPLQKLEGPVLWVEFRISVLVDENHLATGLLGVARDISQRRQAEKAKQGVEAQLRQQQKLESIGTLASGVAHEINNPINIIMNFGELIARRYDGQRGDVREYASEIIRESRRIAGIVHNLLTFSRQEQEQHQAADMGEIIRDTLSLMNKILEKDQIRLDLDLPDGIPRISCKKQQIMQVLMNLLTNARDALNQRYQGHHPDKLILIRTRPFEKNGALWLRTSVEDRGTGIPDEIKDRVFDPFFTSKGRAQGTGLGLSVSHGIVMDHHGNLSMESRPNDYTRFFIDLPASHP